MKDYSWGKRRLVVCIIPTDGAPEVEKLVYRHRRITDRVFSPGSRGLALEQKDNFHQKQALGREEGKSCNPSKEDLVSFL